MENRSERLALGKLLDSVKNPNSIQKNFTSASTEELYFRIQNSLMLISALSAVLTSYITPTYQSLNVLEVDKRLRAYKQSIGDVVGAVALLQLKIDASLEKAMKMCSDNISAGREIERNILPLETLVEEALDCKPGGKRSDSGNIILQCPVDVWNEICKSNKDLSSKLRPFSIPYNALNSDTDE